MIKQIFEIESGQNIPVSFPDKCPYCNKDYIFSHPTATLLLGHLFFVPVSCLHCGEPLMSIYDIEQEKTVNNFPTSSIIEFQQEIKDLSPIACEVLKQTLLAKSLGFNYLVGAGLRKSLEHLIYDYLIKFKKFSENKIKNKTLYERIQLIETDNYKKVCANIVRVFGNGTTHIVNDNNLEVDDAIKILNILIDSIYAEIFVQNVNAKL